MNRGTSLCQKFLHLLKNLSTDDCGMRIYHKILFSFAVVILDIEVQGALQVTSKRPDTVRIFIAPPSWKELERRLKDRGTDDPDKVQKRLLRAKVEFQTANTYDYFVINDTVEEAVRELDAIITAEHCKPKERMAILGE